VSACHQTTFLNTRATAASSVQVDTASLRANTLRTLEETRGEQLRTGLTLPEEIDAVIVITDAEVLDYGLVGGWRRRAIESLPGI
jgi:hypothetical protein